MSDKNLEKELSEINSRLEYIEQSLFELKGLVSNLPSYIKMKESIDSYKGLGGGK